jgi:hypothetical protein
MIGYVGSAPACYGSNPDISQKYQVGYISRGVANILYPPKIIQKKIIYVYLHGAF